MLLGIKNNAGKIGNSQGEKENYFLGSTLDSLGDHSIIISTSFISLIEIVTCIGGR